MCYQGFRNRAKKSSVNKDMLEKVFDDFKKDKLAALMLSMSDPLLYEEFHKVLELAKKADIMDIFLFTNGTLLNEKNSKMILNSSVTRLYVSVDRATSETHNKVRLRVSDRLKDSNRLDNLENNIKKFIDIRKKLNLELPIVRTSFIALD
jgi:MoaA/NifB/PqqE/SkfB family radical SAM enzyme